MSGNDKMRFVVPLPLLSRVSSHLHSLVKRPVSATHSLVTLETADEGTFYRFYQFICTGSYDSFTPHDKVHVAASDTMGVASPVDIVAEAGNETPSQTELFAERRRMANKVDNFKLPYSLVSYERALRSLTTPLLPSKRKCASERDISPHQEVKLNTISSFLQNCELLPLFGQKVPNETHRSFENVFIGNAIIWRFAETYAIPALQDVARSELARQLALWVITDSAFVTELGTLVRYLYRGYRGRTDALQGLIAHFAACVVEDVKGLTGWQELLMEVPAFCRDLLDACSDSQQGKYTGKQYN